MVNGSQAVARNRRVCLALVVANIPQNLNKFMFSRLGAMMQ